ncbi:site-specific DNA-methyltransferase [Candidatus Kuenenbacteria bacterium CG23_combo_of_CG06-09_8_20_14_all_36_9]|nr:MAG: site-specific DNA-methyltransferase [Candidatus Kuenenbacteria bacterium CG23_combo_of_CG06-09_8_20_14_all_36_9]
MKDQNDNINIKIVIGDSRKMDAVKNNSVNLIITSPPYFNAKEYSKDYSGKDLGNIDDYELWKKEIKKVWKECFRVLQPGRKMFINIMNLPLSNENNNGNGFRTLNIVGHIIDMCEEIGFIFKREIIWHKTNGVRANFGTYPYPGGILINNMHEQILEFDKPNGNGSKYEHLSKEIKEASKLTKIFWLSLKNSDVWLMKPYKSGSREHLAPFPLELPLRLIKAYSYISEIILDPFGGMGTTAKAAIREKRSCIIYEINKDFLPLIKNNLNDTLFDNSIIEVIYK